MQYGGVTGGGEWHHPGGDTTPKEKNCGYIYKEHWTTKCVEDGSCDETTAKKGHHFVAMTRKGRRLFRGKK